VLVQDGCLCKGSGEEVGLGRVSLQKGQLVPDCSVPAYSPAPPQCSSVPPQAAVVPRGAQASAGGRSFRGTAAPLDQTRRFPRASRNGIMVMCDQIPLFNTLHFPFWFGFVEFTQTFLLCFQPTRHPFYPFICPFLRHYVFCTFIIFFLPNIDNVLQTFLTVRFFQSDATH